MKDTIKLLGISASPREHGNSRFLLEVALEAASAVAPDLVETELHSVAGKIFDPCDACDMCHDELGYCKITGDDFDELHDKWIEADAIIYSVPVFHMGVPGNLKNFLDRVGNSVVEGFYSKPWKVIGTITQGSGIATGQEQVMMYLNGHAVMMGCIPPTTLTSRCRPRPPTSWPPQVPNTRWAPTKAARTCSAW